MSNPMHSYATDNADVNLTSAVTIFSESNSGSVPRYVVLNVLIGDGTKNLAASADTLLTFQLSNGGVQADEIERTIPSGQARARFQTDPIIWVNGETLALTCSSDQAGDTDVDVTVTAYDVAPLQPATSGRTVTVESDGMAHADTKEVAGQTASATGAVNMSNLDATISSRATPTNVSDAQTAIINAVNAVNTGAARYISIHTNAAYEIPDSGSVAYPIEIRTFDADGEPAAIDAVADPTVTVTRTTDSADLSGNLAAFSSPATAVYRTTLTITQGSDTVAPLRIDASGAIATVTRSTSAYPVITDAVAVDFTATDRANLAAILEDTGTTLPAQITNRTLLAAEYGTASNQTTIINNIAALPAAVWAIATNTLTTAGTIGKLIVDQFTAVLSAISGIEGGEGSGANAITITVTDADSNPLETISVRRTKGADTRSRTTNASGQTTFNLDAGTWTLSASEGVVYYLSGASGTGVTYDSDSQTAEVVVAGAGSQSVTLVMTAIGLSVPESPRIRARLMVLDATTKLGLPDISLTVTVAGAAAAAGYGSRVTSRTITSDANGLAEWYALPGEDYTVTGPSGTEYTIRIPSTATDPHSLTSILI